MNTAPALDTLSVTEYLRIERAAAARSEFWDGRMYAMAGGSPAPAIIGMNVGTALNNALRDTRCTVFSPDMKVRALDASRCFYPDVSVACAEPQFHDAAGDVLLNPILIVEVLSDSTEVADRGPKWLEYRRLPSLRAYVLVDQHQPVVEVYWRGEDGQWRFDAAIGREAELAIPPLNLRLALADVYAKVTLTPRPAPGAPAAPRA
jgi:Uma2 family endonuclease